MCNILSTATKLTLQMEQLKNNKQGGLAQSVASSHGDLKIAGSNPSRVHSGLHPNLVGKMRSTRDLSYCAQLSRRQ